MQFNIDIEKIKGMVPNDKKTIILYAVLATCLIGGGWYLFSGRTDISAITNGIDNAIERLHTAKRANDAAANGVERVQGQLGEYGTEASRMADESGSIAAGLQESRDHVNSVRTGLEASSRKLNDIQQIIDRDIKLLRAIQERSPVPEKTN